jgi:hypothetical protein
MQWGFSPSHAQASPILSNDHWNETEGSSVFSGKASVFGECATPQDFV